MNCFLPTATFSENHYAKALLDLLFVDYDEMSSREKSWIDSAIDAGDLYNATYNKLASGTQVFATDLGDPELKAEVRVPAEVPKEKGIFLLRDLVESLQEFGLL